MLQASVGPVDPFEPIPLASSTCSLRVLLWRHYLETWGIRCFLRAHSAGVWTSFLRGVRSIPLALTVRRRDFPRARELLVRRGRG